MRDKNQNLDSSRARRCTLISGTNGLSKVVATRFADESGGLISRFAGLAKLLVISPDKGAETIIYLASSPKIAATTAFNVVRVLVKPGREQEFLNAHRNVQTDWPAWERRRELAESTVCSQRKPRSFRCSDQPAGSRGVRRINVWAVSCDGFRPLMMAVVMSDASQGRRRRE
jgi:hypothetical protein